MRVLVGHDGSSYADAAIEDLKRAGLPERVQALVVTVGEPPVVQRRGKDISRHGDYS